MIKGYRTVFTQLNLFLIRITSYLPVSVRPKTRIVWFGSNITVQAYV
jgi:hypothetical protein